MRITSSAGSRAGLDDLAEDLNGLMADLEDVREDAQELLEENALDCVRAAIEKMDDALRLLAEAADGLDMQE